MKTCLIAPIPDLERFVADRFKHHLLLDHLFDVPDWGEVYREFYARRRRAGDFITIDNGAKEHNRGSSLAQLLVRASEVKADEVVVADIQFRGRESLELSLDEMHALEHDRQTRDLFEAAGKPRLMVVPHGETIIDWRNCMYGLLRKAERVMGELEGKAYTIGVPYAYDHVHELGLCPLVKYAINEVGGQHVHLLGWPRRLETLENISLEFPEVRSIDSSRPIAYAQQGHLLKPMNGAYPTRHRDYFTTPTSWEWDELVRENIDLFRLYARET